MGKQYKIKTYYYGAIKYHKDDDTVYYTIKDEKNNDIDITSEKLTINQLNIIDLAIQAYPGTKFSINGNSTPIIVGPSGIFQWKVLDNEGYINSIQFKEFPYEMTDDQVKQINMIVTYGYYEE